MAKKAGKAKPPVDEDEDILDTEDIADDPENDEANTIDDDTSDDEDAEPEEKTYGNGLTLISRAAAKKKVKTTVPVVITMQAEDGVYLDELAKKELQVGRSRAYFLKQLIEFGLKQMECELPSTARRRAAAEKLTRRK